MNPVTLKAQIQRNEALLDASLFESRVLPFFLSLESGKAMTANELDTLHALQKHAARIAVSALDALARTHELDSLGGGLDLIPALLMTQAVLPAGCGHYTIEHAHTSIGYHSVLCALGYLDEQQVIERFRRSPDTEGQAGWVPGGTELNGGRPGVMVPAAVGQALGLKALEGDDAWCLCHCGDPGWVSDQALNGFNAAKLHQAPITFVLHRNGIQLSGPAASIMDKDPRRLISSLGIEIIEVPSLLDTQGLYAAYQFARKGVREGRPNLIYPTGYRSSEEGAVTVRSVGERYGIESDVAAFADSHGVDLDREIWIPGSLMGYRHVQPMLEYLFRVNDLPGSAGHHEVSVQGRSLTEVLAGPMLTLTREETEALDALKKAHPVMTVTRARPAPGSPNLLLTDTQASEIDLPSPGALVSGGVGVESGYRAVTGAFPDQCFVVTCDVDASTGLADARKVLPSSRQFEMGIQDQAAAILAHGLSVCTKEPQLVVFSTFGAFFEETAREGMEMWRYQRNLNGVNQGVNVTFHLSHVGAGTGGDFFPGWSLDWISLAMGYLPYLHRFYTPADARSAWIAIRDLAAHFGGHIIGIPGGRLPILTRQGTGAPLFNATDSFESVTSLRHHEGAEKAVLAVGATAGLAADAVDELAASGVFADAYVINGLPLEEEAVQDWIRLYPGGLITIEDGVIGRPDQGLRGFASLVSTAASGSGCPLDHLGIVEPVTAPSGSQQEVWAHFGITKTAVLERLQAL